MKNEGHMLSYFWKIFLQRFLGALETIHNLNTVAVNLIGPLGVLLLLPLGDN